MASVLVVEGEMDVREILLDRIREDGHEAVGVERTSEALDLVDHRHPDLIILDVVMPPREVDGIEFLFRLRRKPHAADIPVMVVSGLHQKPLAAEDLLGQIKSILKRA
jgi:two-component system, OmpR family, response regulator MprA